MTRSRARCEAVFSVAGLAGETANQFMAMNATSIGITDDGDGGWQIDGFLLEYEDGNHAQWTAMIEASTWR
jgi:hypothetical protein